jgi:hypothetical protein
MAGAYGLTETRLSLFRYFFLIGFTESPAATGLITDSMNLELMFSDEHLPET